jgi:tetratricopeptide (TPR) repeat protein
LVKKSSNKNLANFALAHLAFKIGNYQQAIEILNELIIANPTQRSYRILATCHKFLGNNEDYQKYLTLAKNFTKS